MNNNYSVGDHLVLQRTGYSHHGLYVGNELVIHYAGLSRNSDSECVELISLDRFLGSQTPEVKQHNMAIYSPEERVSRAYQRLGEDEYSLLFNNCEHFINWCIYGVKLSTQVQRATLACASVGVGGYQLLKTKQAEKETAQMIGSIAKKVAGNSAGTIVSTTHAASTTSFVAAGVTSSVAGSSGAVLATAIVSGAAAPAAVATGVGFVTYKLVNWLFD